MKIKTYSNKNDIYYYTYCETKKGIVYASIIDSEMNIVKLDTNALNYIINNDHSFKECPLSSKMSAKYNVKMFNDPNFCLITDKDYVVIKYKNKRKSIKRKFDREFSDFIKMYISKDIFDSLTLEMKLK